VTNEEAIQLVLFVVHGSEGSVTHEQLSAALTDRWLTPERLEIALSAAIARGLIVEAREEGEPARYEIRVNGN
jgi:hypothetical protein